MYKKQLRFQKFGCLFSLITAAMSFLYSLGIVTDIYDSLYFSMWSDTDPSKTDIPGSFIYYDMQAFNKMFVNVSIVLILLACLLFIMNTQIRRKYYIGNYFSIGVYSVATVAAVIWSHIEIAAFKTQFLTTVDFAAMKEYSEFWGTKYIDSTFWFDVHYFVGGLQLLSVVALIGCAIWKVQLMRAEDALIKEGKEAAV